MDLDLAPRLSVVEALQRTSKHVVDVELEPLE